MQQNLNNATYDSIAEFISAIMGPCRNRDNASVRDEFATKSDRDRSNWYGADCATGADVRRKVTEGWPQGRERLNELRDKMGTLNLAPVSRRRRMVRGDQGDVLDIHSVFAGRLDIAWQTAKRRNVRGPEKIELCANMLCSGGEHADVLFWRDAAAAVLTDVLEQAGYMVRLVVNFGGEAVHTDEKVSCRITVKEHGIPFDVSSISATIMPGFFRALGHAWVAAHAKGKLHSPSLSVRQGIVEPGEILLSHSVRDHATALAFVNDTIERINQPNAA